MRISVISTNIFRLGLSGTSGYSGLEHIAWQVAVGLARKGHKVSLIAPEGSECPGVTIVSNGPERSLPERLSYDRYWKHLLDVDVVIDHSWEKHSYRLRMEGVLKAPVLGVLHAPVETMYNSLPPIPKPCMVCISEDQRNRFEIRFDHDARVCRNGVDLNEFYKPVSVPRTKRYLFLARFSSIKGPDLALKACKTAGVGLDLIGDTSITQEPEYLEQCKRECDGKQCRLIGGVLRGETVFWFSQAHALLHPNQRFAEPLGLSPLESLACGTPVLAWKKGAMKETIKHGEVGFLVSSLEEMTELIKTDAVSQIDRTRCREWVGDNFSLQKMVDRYEELCTEALNTGGW